MIRMLLLEPEVALCAFLIKMLHALTGLYVLPEAIVPKYLQISQIVKFVIRFVLEALDNGYIMSLIDSAGLLLSALIHQSVFNPVPLNVPLDLLLTAKMSCTAHAVPSNVRCVKWKSL